MNSNRVIVSLIICIIAIAALATIFETRMNSSTEPTMTSNSSNPESSDSKNSTTINSTSMISSRTVMTCSNAVTTTNSANHSTNAIYATVNYTGAWNATITAYHDLIENDTNLSLYQCLSGTGDNTIVLHNSNPSGEFLACLQAQKLDSSNSNLTVSIQTGSVLMSNSTVTSFGSAKICIGLVM